MIIRKSKFEDVEEIMKIYNSAKVFMRETGNPFQWNGTYPEKTLIEKDILSNNSYVCVDDGIIVGTFYFVIGIDPTYNVIVNGNWLDDASYGVIHRIASLSRNNGVATECINYCFNLIKNLRIDTHKDNSVMRNFLKKNGFHECGIIFLTNGDERFAYHKIK
jgi:RimJ/RimL family protein N-acetyltransferase